MTTFSLRNFWQSLRGRNRETAPIPVHSLPQLRPASIPAVQIAPNDPLVAYLQSVASTVEIDRLELDSPALRALKAGGAKLAVPLISHGELIGLLNLGPRLSEQEYSSDDRALLNNLATQAAPAVQVAQLVRQQQIELQARERLEQELRVARLIQQTLLPKELPALAGWQVAAYYQPALAVGGDFYDFIYLPDDRVGLVIGDVTDKGVPAALVMATTRAILRAATQGLDSPGMVLQRVNDLLCPDIPSKMFVTCLYAILDPASGRLLFANAGHDLPYRRSDGRALELRATGMPLGLMPGMTYEENEVTLAPGESILFYSDGLVEAHNSKRDMFSFPRLETLIAGHPDSSTMINFLLDELARFTGADWEQEDDVTLVTLERTSPPVSPSISQDGSRGEGAGSNGWRILGEFDIPSEEGNERLAMDKVAGAVRPLGLTNDKVERLKTAVSEAAMNAIEHGNKYRADLPVSIQVRASDALLSVCITDEGGSEMISAPDAPDLEAKLEGLQAPRGWGLFLIQNMVDKLNIIREGGHHTVELIVYMGGDENGSETV
jgi:serine phosphatase RsbU (regulator of sigma subunit)/anti-sigma regulatory factor (Ser/Thr protein kinase)